MAEKYVIDGAKVKCTMCSKPEGKLMVTSNTISIQDKFWATEDDKGKPNVVFQGNCLKFSNNPPPCQSVMALSQWQKTAIGVTIDNKAPLLENSLIMCTTGGVPVTIVDTKQKSIPTNLASLAKEGAPVPAVVITNDPEIVDAYWVDENQDKTTLIAYKENNIKILIKTKNALGKNIRIMIYESDTGVDDFIHTYEFNLEHKSTLYTLDFDGELFNKGGDAIAELYFTLQIEGQSKKIFANSENEYLKIHMVRYVPTIMGGLGWTNAKKLQDAWFEGKANEEPWTINPKVDFLAIDWILGVDRMKNLYLDIIKDKWNSVNAIKLLKKRIKEMVANNHLILPSKKDKEVTFGVFSQKIQKFPNIEQPKLGGKKEPELMPLFERYYHQSISYKISRSLTSSEPLDDMFGTLASCQFRVIASGTITKKESTLFGNIQYYKVKIDTIGVYVKDSFDFITKDEYLGDWSPKDNSVLINPYFPAIKGYTIENKSYRDYRKDYKKGMDYNLYSNIKKIKVDYEFTATTNELE